MCKKQTYQLICHIVETYAPHLFLNTETYSGCRQRHVSLPLADPVSLSDLIILTTSCFFLSFFIHFVPTCFNNLCILFEKRNPSSTEGVSKLLLLLNVCLKNSLSCILTENLFRQTFYFFSIFSCSFISEINNLFRLVWILTHSLFSLFDYERLWIRLLMRFLWSLYRIKVVVKRGMKPFNFFFLI